MHGCKVDLQRYRATSGEQSFIDCIKAPVYLETVLAIDIRLEPKSNLEDKFNPCILKDDFHQELTPLLSHQ